MLCAVDIWHISCAATYAAPTYAAAVYAQQRYPDRACVCVTSSLDVRLPCIYPLPAHAMLRVILRVIVTVCLSLDML